MRLTLLTRTSSMFQICRSGSPPTPRRRKRRIGQIDSVFRVLLFVLSFLFVSTAVSQNRNTEPEIKILTAGPTASMPRVRSNAPIGGLWQVTSRASSILEGHFEMTYTDGRRTLYRFRSHHMVLSPGQQVVRMVIPTAGSQPAWIEDRVELKFITEDETYELGPFPLAGRIGARSLNICVCGTDDRKLIEPQEEMIQSLRFGKLLREEQSPITTMYTHWLRDDMPATPLHYCNFDIVVLTDRLFAELRQRQLDALLKWTEAGGSICVFL